MGGCLAGVCWSGGVGSCSGAGWSDQAAVVAAAARATTEIVVICGGDGGLVTLSDAMFGI